MHREAISLQYRYTAPLVEPALLAIMFHRMAFRRVA
ncbi:hypothetical protein Brsp02_04598 [Brucella sp. NBRC 113783]